jgi:hypothetical protein
MAELEKEEFKFPDEQEAKGKSEAKEDEFEIEIEDDTPPEDKGREPMPKEVVEELEQDELEEYSDKVKTRLKQMKKVWHDERRAKEAAYREQQEAVELAKKVMEENKRIKAMLSTGEKEYAETIKGAAEMQLDMAKKAYKEAYDSGDADQIVEAQQAMQEANIRLMQARNFKPSAVQDPENEVQHQQIPQQPVAPQPDRRAMAWQERNPWFGQDEEMTASALGLHEKLKRNGVVVGSDEYYATLDKTIRKRFNEYFDEPEETQTKAETPRTKPSTVVAPAMRSTSSKKVKLSQSQASFIKKLGITPEQYVREYMKLENANG